MEIYLLRHGVAVEHGTRGITEEQRPLTPEGAAKMRTAAEGMKKFGVAFDALLTSPLERARQTADIVASVYGAKDRLKDVPALKPGLSVEKLWQALKPYSEMRRVMIVGHEPDLSQLAAILLTGHADGLDLQLKKGALCLIEIDSLPPKGRGQLCWLLTGKQFRMMK
ncbi:MAG: phosphohistidine phosphatase SixA [Terriglobia bacterium]